MKLIIDIPEEHYRTLQEAMKNHMVSLIGKIILNGTPIPDNATNGDVIISLYPNLEYTVQNDRVKKIGVANSFDTDWWNEPYQKGGK